MLQSKLAALDWLTTVDVNQIRKCLYIFTTSFAGEMKKNLEQSGFGSSLADTGCGKCLITKDNRADLTFHTDCPECAV